MSLLRSLDKDTVEDLDVLDYLFLDVTDILERRRRIVASVIYLETFLTLRLTKAERAKVIAIKQQLTDILSQLPKSYPQDPTLPNCLVNLVRNRLPTAEFAPILSAARQRAKAESPAANAECINRFAAMEIRSRTPAQQYNALLEDARDYMRSQEDRTASIRAKFGT